MSYPHRHDLLVMESVVQQSRRTGLTGDIEYIMIVCEAVEPRSGAFGVRAHLLKVKPVAHIKHSMKCASLRNAVYAVARLTPDGVYDIVRRLIALAQNTRSHELVVEDQVGEVAIDPVIEVDHVVRLSSGWIHDVAAGDDVACEGEC